MLVIFDFDQTLADTSPAQDLRASRNWQGVMAMIAELPVYDGITELLTSLHAGGTKIAIVTKSPDMVPKAFIKRYQWPVDLVVGYHDVHRRKPDPAGLLLAMSRLAVDPSDTVHVGDDPDDSEAARRAGVHSIGCTWGIGDSRSLVASQPDQLVHTVQELRDILLARG